MVGATCLYTFTSSFATLNGVYRTRAETTFLDAVASGVDFVSNLYTPAGLSRTQYNADYSSYQSDMVAVIESVTNNSLVYYVPESILATVPDPTIKEYYPLILVANLGVQQNPQVVLPLIDAVKDKIQATLGTTDPVRVVTNPENKVYLTDSQYETLVAARAANIQALSPLSVQLQAANTQIAYLAAKVASYEALIAQLSGV